MSESVRGDKRLEIMLSAVVTITVSRENIAMLENPADEISDILLIS